MLPRPVVLAILGLIATLAALALAVSARYDGEGGTQAVAAVSAPVATADFPRAFINVVRLGDRGDVVIAGQAAPGAEIEVRYGEHDLGRAIADIRGEWVLVPSEALPPGVRPLTVLAIGADGGRSSADEPVILVVPEQAGDAALAFKPRPQGGGALLSAAPPLARRLEIHLMERDASGALFVSGRADPGFVVQLYVDGRFLGRANVEGDGRWTISARAPTKAGHMLRADMVEDARNKVRARVEAPYDGAPLALPDSGPALRAERRALGWCVVRRNAAGGTVWTVVYRE